MNDTNGVRFDTTNVRGFAEYLHHLWDTKYRDRADSISAKLAGGEATGGSSDLAAGSGSGSMGSSGVQYDGLELGKTEVENAQAGDKALRQFMRAWESMAKAGAFAAEEYSGQDAKNADELEGQFEDTDTVVTERLPTQR